MSAIQIKFKNYSSASDNFRNTCNESPGHLISLRFPFCIGVVHYSKNGTVVGITEVL